MGSCKEEREATVLLCLRPEDLISRKIANVHQKKLLD